MRLSWVGMHWWVELSCNRTHASEHTKDVLSVGWAWGKCKAGIYTGLHRACMHGGSLQNRNRDAELASRVSSKAPPAWARCYPTLPSWAHPPACIRSCQAGWWGLEACCSRSRHGQLFTCSGRRTSPCSTAERWRSGEGRRHRVKSSQARVL